MLSSIIRQARKRRGLSISNQTPTSPDALMAIAQYLEPDDEQARGVLRVGLLISAGMLTVGDIDAWCAKRTRKAA